VLSGAAANSRGYYRNFFLVRILVDRLHQESYAVQNKYNPQLKIESCLQ